MSGCIEGFDREQVTLFPERLEDWIDEDPPVRVIDSFIDAMDLSTRRTWPKAGLIGRHRHRLAAPDIIRRFC